MCNLEVGKGHVRTQRNTRTLGAQLVAKLKATIKAVSGAMGIIGELGVGPPGQSREYWGQGRINAGIFKGRQSFLNSSQIGYGPISQAMLGECSD